MSVIKQGKAVAVVMYYEVMEPALLEGPEVELHDNGIVHIKTEEEEITSHISRMEIVWKAPEGCGECSSCAAEQDKDEPKLIHLRKRKKNEEDKKE